MIHKGVVRGISRHSDTCSAVNSTHSPRHCVPYTTEHGSTYPLLNVGRTNASKSNDKGTTYLFMCARLCNFFTRFYLPCDDVRAHRTKMIDARAEPKLSGASPADNSKIRLKKYFCSTETSRERRKLIYKKTSPTHQPASFLSCPREIVANIRTRLITLPNQLLPKRAQSFFLPPPPPPPKSHLLEILPSPF